MKKYVKHSINKFLSQLSTKKGKTLSAQDVHFISTPNVGIGIGIVIDGEFYDLQSVAEFEEVLE